MDGGQHAGNTDAVGNEVGVSSWLNHALPSALTAKVSVTEQAPAAAWWAC
jgi:hypothetical protein